MNPEPRPEVDGRRPKAPRHYFFAALRVFFLPAFFVPFFFAFFLAAILSVLSVGLWMTVGPLTRQGWPPRITG